MNTEDELYKKLEEYGKNWSCPFTAKEMLTGKVSIDRLGGYAELRDYVQEYRKKHRKKSNKSGPKREDFFKDHYISRDGTFINKG